MSQLEPITKPYLLCSSIKCYQDQKGRKYLDNLWYLDLKKHLEYLTNFTLLCPLEPLNNQTNLVCIDDDSSFNNVNFIGVPSPKNLVKAISLLPVTVRFLWEATGQADIVHGTLSGWPIPMAWLNTPIVKIRRKFYILIVESSTWRLDSRTKISFKEKINAYVRDQLTRWCVNNANLPIFTQQEYKTSFLTKPNKEGYVINASWIDEEIIISDEEAKKQWQEKNSVDNERLKLLFAARLVEAKGVLILLEAIKILNKEEVSVDIDILGQGELLEECQKLSEMPFKTVNIKILGTVPYGSEFFNLLQKYHGIIIPTLSSEQPRLAYDAYSQAIPILASDTPGNIDVVQDGKTGKLTKVKDPIALAELIKWSCNNLNELETMGIASLELARNMTHRDAQEAVEAFIRFIK